MFVSCLLPYSVRDIEAPHLWVFYKQLSHFKKDEIIFIGTEEYFKDPAYYAGRNRWETLPLTLAYHESTLPTKQDIDQAARFTISDRIFKELEERSGSREAVLRLLLTERYEKLEARLDEIFGEIDKTEKIEAALAWFNSPSLCNVAGKRGVRVIHNELGPLRKPFYRNTAYFDFSGVNGNTEALDRFLRFRNESSGCEAALLPKKELRTLFLEENYAHLAQPDVRAEYEIGLPLQVEDDSNILAFSNGQDNRTLIKAANGPFKKSEILIRRHPAGLLDYGEESGVPDNRANAIEFILSCKKIATVNSSVGLEAILFDKPAHILGQCPFSFLASNDPDLGNSARKTEEDLTGLNFMLFGYLIPYEFLFDTDYYRWRLSGPPERDIFGLHRLCYLNERAAVRRDFVEIPKVDVPTLALKHAIMHRGRKITDREHELGRKIADKDRQIAETNRRLTERDRQLTEVLNSRSWRFTAPIRRISVSLRNIRDSIRSGRSMND